jgi:hypothetical protein
MEVIYLAWDSLLEFTETAVTASKNGSNINIGPTGIVETLIDITAVSGTSPTLKIKFQESEDGVSFNDLLDAPQLTAIGKDTVYFKTNKKYVRYVLTVTGTSPSFDFVIRMR